jgi:hypothetical protein
MIRVTKIIPKIIGLIIFPNNIPNLNQSLFKGDKKLGNKIEIIRKTIESKPNERYHKKILFMKK